MQSADQPLNSYRKEAGRPDGDDVPTYAYNQTIQRTSAEVQFAHERNAVPYVRQGVAST